MNQKPRKPRDTIRIRTDKEKIWVKKRSVIAPNDCPHSYNVLNKKGNLIIRNCHHLIPKNEKLIVRHDYDVIRHCTNSHTVSETHILTYPQTHILTYDIAQTHIPPSETTLHKTHIPSNITTPPVRTKSRSIIKKPKRYLVKC